ncbi:hypothetical protein BDW02DRAFT_636652 [Decorospora gaudefroyi]|uniref:Uncharacterized protein n=1 Tax=Decorospora gaudefroyi TaxID=184978 RepID=A0A6A5KM83_9PLEO|nr:hypothetical protein BDW02DRAFT_636652 [Decorospora gaudefroyi]
MFVSYSKALFPVIALSMFVRDSCASNSSPTLRGPSSRGTFDILWTSLVTIGISTYTMLCLNVPAPTDSYVRLVGRRILWMLLGILGPEFVLIYAAGQWSRAKWSVENFKEDHPDWHMRHAFFADMGGFVLHTEDGVVFPVNAVQLRWLVRHEYIEYPKISRKGLWDKSKQDTFTKVITAFQVGYMIIQCAARAAQQLTITTPELNALAIDMIGNLEWDLTPLDHVDLNGPGYSVNVQPFMGMPVMPSKRPIQRIPNDRFPMDPYGAQEYLLCFATLLFTAIHVAGWNFDFPTPTERLLWRISSLLLFGITVAFCRKITHRQTLQPKRKMTELPLPWEFAMITPLAVIYGIARLYLIVEAFAELRDVGGTAYVHVEWTSFFPHV